MDSTRQKGINKQKRPRSGRIPVEVLAREAVEAMLDKKALGVTVMDMRAVSGVADVFVVGTGESDLQIKAIADAVVERNREHHGERPWHTEGYDGRQWVLLDYVDLVVHIFSPEKREFYNLERLWGDAPREEVSETGSSENVGLLNELAEHRVGTSSG
ncbi:MAG: ribosome silencing factor [Rhodothermales bacterium]